MKKIICAIGAFFRAKWGEYTPHGQFLFILALAAIAVDAAIAYEYGVSMTVLHGIGFALVAIAFAVLPDQASLEWTRGKKSAAFWIGIACVPLGVVGYQSHIGYGAGVRLGDMQQTGVQNVRYDDAREKVADSKRNLALWTKQLDELRTAAPWVATVNAEGLRAQLPAMDKSIELETRRGGCGQKCQKLMEAKAAHEDRIATAEQRVDLEKRIAATQLLVDKYREASAGTELRSSTVVNQNGVFAKLWKAVNGSAPEDAIKADAVTQEFVSIFTAGSGALAFMMLAPLLMFAAGRNRKESLGLPSPSSGVSSTEAQASYAPNPVNDQIEALRSQLAALVPSGKGVNLNVVQNGIRSNVERLTALRLAGA